uniref:ATP synthase F0 subunit 6 n=1 Tax=Dollfusiella sp. MZUSP 7992 TaxID=2899499 RepID=A0A8K1SXT6_9CEST|nr:ATP synthase F0 subunit 6 [Dollfusiella sp. MZUSP 7992]
MMFVYNNISSVGSLIYSYFIQKFSYYYLYILTLVLSLFLLYRFPYSYTPFFFSIFLLCVVFSCFLALFFSRIFEDTNVFFSGFVPVGTPLYICPLVCLAETVSYIIRPFVLIFRPFINISLGCVGAAALSNFCFVSSIWFLVLLIVFFYEVFVALVHWFIVTNILDFSIDH